MRFGAYETGDTITKEYEAPYAKDVVRKLKAKTKSKAEFVSFIKDYINMPSKRKSLYGKRAIKSFGLMPPLTGVMTDAQETKLANYLYDDLLKNDTKVKTKKVAIKKVEDQNVLFQKHCAECHYDAVGAYETGDTITKEYQAPYAKDVVKKLKAKTKNEAEFVSFIKDYINMPSKRKSLYGRRAIKHFGLMPALTGVMTDAQITKLATDLYNNKY
jgi:macrodomain Ter protein organizer (MatP/YcbG family)